MSSWQAQGTAPPAVPHCVLTACVRRRGSSRFASDTMTNKKSSSESGEPVPRTVSQTAADEFIAILDVAITASDGWDVRTDVQTVRAHVIETHRITEDAVVAPLNNALGMAIEARYRQRCIDALQLALEWVDGRYTVPSENIPEGALPEAYSEPSRGES